MRPHGMSGCPAAAPSVCSSRRSVNGETGNLEGAKHGGRRAAPGDHRHRSRQWRAAPREGQGYRRRSAARRTRKAVAHGQERHGRGRRQKAVSQCLRADRQARHRRRGPHQPGAGAAGARAGLRCHGGRSAHGICQPGALSGCPADRGMAGCRAAAAQCRPLHGVRRADARSQDRRPGAAARLRARLLLYRRAGIAEDPCQARRTAAGAGRQGKRHRPHPCADWPADRRGLAFGDRGRDHGRDHGAIAPASKRKRSRGMKFGPASPADAIGGVTVHTLRQGSLVLKKGTTIGAAEVDALNKAGVGEIVVVRLEEGDISEDIAAASIAQAVAGDGVHVERAFTGRSNLFAARAGVLVVDRAAVDRINDVDEAITFATLAAYKPVVEGEMIATVKLIPFGVEAKLRDAAVAAAGRGALRIAPYVTQRVGVVSTLLPGLSPKVIDKTLRVTAERLAPARATIIAQRRMPPDASALAASIKELLELGAELVIVFGASAIADRRDVIPAAITEIGGAIEHFGMPVDPGNLLLIGKAGGVPVLGAPGCARSPVENGFDWVLMRLLAGLKVTRADLTGMGVGGLLMEIVTRPQPRVPEQPGVKHNI